MTQFNTFDVDSKVAYELFLENGKLMRIHCYSLWSAKTIYEELRDKKINKERFMNAVNVLCKDFEFEHFEDFLKGLSNDKEYLDIAKNIFRNHTIRMSNQVQKISKSLHNIAVSE